MSSLVVWGCWLIPRAFTFRRDGLTPLTEQVVFDYFFTSLGAKGEEAFAMQRAIWGSSQDLQPGH